MMNEQETAERPIPRYLDPRSVQAHTSNRNRHLIFSGAQNFRELGGYPALDGKSIRWKRLYRSDALHKLTWNDLKRLNGLGLARIIDFRSQFEKNQQPNRLPPELASRLVEIPILDSSTQFVQASRDEVIRKLKSIDPVHFLTQTNVELATRYTPEMRKFMEVLLSADGGPVLIHCTAGKDRTGFAAAILLRILGVPQEIVMADYLLTNQYVITAHRWRLSLLRLWKGKQVAQTVTGMLQAQPAYLSAAFQAIDQNHGSFDGYIRNALQLTASDVEYLKSLYLE
jgi:protein-tyrosine phosphatase